MKSALEKRIIEKKTPKRHTTALRMPNEQWSRLTRLAKKTNLALNDIINIAVDELIQKESFRLQK